MGGTLRSWTADLVYVTWDGTIWVRESKRTAADLADPEYQAKLESVRWLLSPLGWIFRPWTLAEILGTVERQVDTATIYVDRSASLDDLMPRFEEIAAETEVITFGDLARALDDRNANHARAAVRRLIMRGRVWVDLDRLIEDWTEVRLRPAPLITLDPPFA